MRAPRKYEARQGGFHGDPMSGNQPCWRPPTSTITLKGIQWKYLCSTVLYLSSTSDKGGKGRVVNLVEKQSTMMAKLKQMANKADSSAHGDANPCGHLACRFVRKTAGRIDSRLTLPKLHLATRIIEAQSIESLQCPLLISFPVTSDV